MFKRSFPVSIAAVIFLLFGVNSAFGQCGDDGTKPCSPTPKKTIPKKTILKPTTKTTVSKPKIITKKTKTTVLKSESEPVNREPQIEMVKIPSGSFMMGSENGGADEKPVHRVNIINSFYMGKYEVTQAQWKAVIGNNPSNFSNCGGDCPVEKVSWDDAQEFIRKLNNLQNEYEYRLPTEAEWEYACRAGTTGDYAGNLASMAWYGSNSGRTTHLVGRKQANNFGLFDMSGNVFEWCEDVFTVDYSDSPADGSPNDIGNKDNRTARGGSYFNTNGNGDVYAKSFTRAELPSNWRQSAFGFRVVTSAK